MTKEEILAMEVGRDLDYEVDCKVMGHQRVTWPPAPHYSTDISAAWHILKKLGDHAQITLELRIKPDEVAHFIEICFSIDDAPEAICKAALTAKIDK